MEGHLPGAPTHSPTSELGGGDKGSFTWLTCVGPAQALANPGVSKKELCVERRGGWTVVPHTAGSPCSGRGPHEGPEWEFRTEIGDRLPSAGCWGGPLHPGPRPSPASPTRAMSLGTTHLSEQPRGGETAGHTSSE